MAPLRALELARERNLDLVEISPQAIPPVCKLMDYGRFKYEQAKKDSEARKRQKVSEVKEIRLHAHTDQHDINVKVKKIVQFLDDGDKVKVSVQFRGREVFHPEIGRKLLEDIVNHVKTLVVVERPPLLEGRNLWMMLARVPNYDSAKKALEAATTDTPPAEAESATADSAPQA
jgi:translation initiation factor IF-3